MKSALLFATLGAALLFAPMTYAQNVTATCKDGSAFSGATRSGACRGHKGVASWGTTAAATTTSNPGMAPAAQPNERTASTTPSAPPATIPNRTASTTTGSPGNTARTGGPGQVWVNSSSKVYHCPGDRYYGKTKSGEFMPLSAAQAAGDRPSGGKACTS